MGRKWDTSRPQPSPHPNDNHCPVSTAEKQILARGGPIHRRALYRANTSRSIRAPAPPEVSRHCNGIAVPDGRPAAADSLLRKPSTSRAEGQAENLRVGGAVNRRSAPRPMPVQTGSSVRMPRTPPRWLADEAFWMGRVCRLEHLPPCGKSLFGLAVVTWPEDDPEDFPAVNGTNPARP